MDAVEIQRHIEEIQADIIKLKRRVELLAKQQGEMNEKQEAMNLDIKDTNRESHLAKHASLNVQANLTSFMTLFEKNQRAIETNQESIRDLTAAKKMTEEKVQRVLSWVDEFSDMINMKGLAEMIEDNKLNTKFREGWSSNKAFFITLGAVCGAILAAIALAKAMGLFK